jgi:hypothetical protein
LKHGRVSLKANLSKFGMDFHNHDINFTYNVQHGNPTVTFPSFQKSNSIIWMNSSYSKYLTSASSSGQDKGSTSTMNTLSLSTSNYFPIQLKVFLYGRSNDKISCLKGKGIFLVYPK